LWRKKGPLQGYPLPHGIPSSPILAPYVHGMCMGMGQKQLYHLLGGEHPWTTAILMPGYQGFDPYSSHMTAFAECCLS
jgi:hypothetical protein